MRSLLSSIFAFVYAEGMNEAVVSPREFHILTENVPQYQVRKYRGIPYIVLKGPAPESNPIMVWSWSEPILRRTQQ